MNDSVPIRRFAPLSLGEDTLPDEPAIFRFRQLPEKPQLAPHVFDTERALAEKSQAVAKGRRRCRRHHRCGAEFDDEYHADARGGGWAHHPQRRSKYQESFPSPRGCSTNGASIDLPYETARAARALLPEQGPE